MPPFQRISKDELAKEYAKYVKNKKLVKSNETEEFFTQYGMRPKPEIVLSILKQAFSKFGSDSI